MKSQRLTKTAVFYAGIALTIVVVALNYILFRPYLASLIWAGIISVPLHQLSQKKLIDHNLEAYLQDPIKSLLDEFVIVNLLVAVYGLAKCVFLFISPFRIFAIVASTAAIFLPRWASYMIKSTHFKGKLTYGLLVVAAIVAGLVAYELVRELRDAFEAVSQFIKSMSTGSLHAEPNTIAEKIIGMAKLGFQTASDYCSSTFNIDIKDGDFDLKNIITKITSSKNFTGFFTSMAKDQASALWSTGFTVLEIFMDVFLGSFDGIFQAIVFLSTLIYLLHCQENIFQYSRPLLSLVDGKG